MTDVLAELTDAPLTKTYVERRVVDWERRIGRLYREIGSWLPSEFKAVTSRRVEILEQPMREVGLDARALPALDIFKDGDRRARLEPESLWIIGVNGRLDLSVGLDRYLLVDSAEIFDPPSWFVMKALDQMNRRPFDRAFLLSIL